MVIDDFKCKEVQWENLSTEGRESSWGSKLLDIVIENVMILQIKETMRYEWWGIS